MKGTKGVGFKKTMKIKGNATPADAGATGKAVPLKKGGSVMKKAKGGKVC